jgi:hypothetical protein
MVDTERRVEETQCDFENSASQGLLNESQDRDMLPYVTPHMRAQYKRDSTQSLIYGDIICVAPKTLQVRVESSS